MAAVKSEVYLEYRMTITGKSDFYHLSFRESAMRTGIKKTNCRK